VPLRKFLALLLSLSLLPIGLTAQSAKPASAAKVTISKASPETPEQFAARKLALQEMLQRLTTTGRIMQVVAHPDDEDGAMLTLESRVKGNTAMLFTFTRGEGGQNAQGAVFFDELGILRTLELLAADKEYGAEERFSHVADFGFSKSAEESFQKWGGEDVPEGDLVRAIREFQPDVLVARFSGTPKDGHGHHVASALMTIKAFHDAADAKRFPGDGKPWQPSKLYTGLAGDEATVVPDEDQPSALLGGKTPEQIALEGLRHQESQGLGNIASRMKGPRPKLYSSYKLVDTSGHLAKRGPESDFFDGIHTSLEGLAERFPDEAAKIPDLAQTLGRAANAIQHASDELKANGPAAALKPLQEAAKILAAIPGSECADDCPRGLATRLAKKRAQLESAMELAAGLEVSLTAKLPNRFAMPGEDAPMHLHLANHGMQPIDLRPWGEQRTIPDYIRKLPGKLSPGETADVDFEQPLAELTRAPFYRESAVKDSVYKMRTSYQGWTGSLPFSLVHVTVYWSIGSFRHIATVATPVLIAPPFSVTVAPVAILRRLNQPHESTLQVTAQNNSEKPMSGTVALTLPQGWASEPAQANLSVAAGRTSDAAFTLRWPEKESPMQSIVKATFTSGGKQYSENYHLISRADLPDAFPYYAPAQTTISLINADIPERHNIGYIMGAGDTLPDDLRSLGFDVHLLTESDLANGDLAQYDSIMTGVRAYATRADLRAHNQRLLDYVKQGGTFVVQYEQDYNAFNSGHYTPFPATMGRDRVSQEEQPVKMLDPESSILRYPNRITNADFDNWVQERGLYFMKEWSPDYTPLLSMNDVGEPPLEGGLLVAHYGKGTYIYTGLSFYRELPNGVPGAARLLINLLAAGHNPAEQPTVNARK